ncbi:MAG: CPBP family intramembrane glutamic endopeptidase [Fibrobacterota bacterium]
MKWLSRHPVSGFTGLTFFLSWLLIFTFRGLGYQWNTPAAYVAVLMYMYLPLVSSVVLHRALSRNGLGETLGISFKFNKWFVIAWALPFAAAALALLASLLLPGIGFSAERTALLDRFAGHMTPEQLETARAQLASLPMHPVLLTLAQALIAGATVNALAAFGEEAGWRGFLWRHLEPLGFVKASLTTGLLWGIWHMPLILMGHNYPDHSRAGVFMMVGVTLLLSPLLLYVRIQAKSVIAPSLLHGAFNAAVALPLLVSKGGNDLTVGLTGWTGMAGLLALNALLAVYDRYFAKQPLVFGRTRATGCSEGPGTGS